MEAITNYALPAVTLAVMLFGLFGLLIPILPGLVIIWLAALVYGLVTGFSWGSGILFAIITLLMVAGSLVDNFLMGASARQTGASWLAIGVALVAGVIGSLVWPPFGGLLAALLGLFLVEYLRVRQWRLAWESTRSMATGCGWAVVVRLIMGGVMILLWGIWVLTG